MDGKDKFYQRLRPRLQRVISEWLDEDVEVNERMTEEIADLVFDEVIESVRKGAVHTPLGTFILRLIKSRNVYDIGTGEIFTHPPSRVLRLIPGRGATARIKEGKAKTYKGRDMT